jgi:triosephosphate isomerase
MRARLVVGNWKMNGGLASNAALLDRIVAGAGRSLRGIAVCVPFPYLAQAEQCLAERGIDWGAQDVSEHAPGAYTGEVAAEMLTDFGCRYVIVGHSERRHGLGESDASVAAKARRALSAGLTPIVCVGETQAERDAGSTDAVVLCQLDAVLDACAGEAARMVYAYEPVWAIGTGRSARPADAQAVHEALRVRLAEVGAGEATLLYGGSVKASNAASLFAMPDIDGALVGGASLDPEKFARIVKAAL